MNIYASIFKNSYKTNRVLYVGVTNDLARRIYEHKNNLVEGFTKRYHVHKLVYYEMFPSIENSIRQEKQLKNWHRPWKNNLIQEVNPEWTDLYETLNQNLLGS